MVRTEKQRGVAFTIFEKLGTAGRYIVEQPLHSGSMRENARAHRPLARYSRWNNFHCVKVHLRGPVNLERPVASDTIARNKRPPGEPCLPALMYNRATRTAKGDKYVLAGC